MIPLIHRRRLLLLLLLLLLHLCLVECKHACSILHGGIHCPGSMLLQIHRIITSESKVGKVEEVCKFVFRIDGRPTRGRVWVHIDLWM